MTTLDPYDIAFAVAQGFESIGVEYFLGGSMASSLQGPPRYTQDIDFVANLKVHHVQPLIHALGSDFDVDDEALTEAIRLRRSWNIFHTPTATRIDLFPVGPTEFDVEELFRRQRIETPSGKLVFVKSAEDTILRKLDWYRQGGESNTQQFRDVVGVLRFQGPSLNQRYLDVWAQKLNLSGLLARARAAVIGQT